MADNWQQQVGERFDRAAPDYDTYAEVQRESARRLAQLISSNPQSILEIGCGSGALTQQLSIYFPEAQITASDIAPSMLNIAKQKLNAENINWTILDGESPDESDIIEGAYDLIISNMAFQWFADFETALNGMKKYLKPGGQILYAIPGERSFSEWQKTLRSLNLPSGLLEFPQPSTENILEEQSIEVFYYDALTFLKSMKKIGAHKPRSGYQPLGYTIKKACDKFDQDFAGRVTWHIIYGQLTK